MDDGHEGAVGRRRRRDQIEGTAGIDAAAAQALALKPCRRQRLPRECGLIEHGRARRKTSIHRHRFAGSHEQAIADAHGVERHALDLPVVVTARCARNAGEERRHLAARPRVGEVLERPAARQHQSDNGGRDIFLEQERACNGEKGDDIEPDLPTHQAGDAVGEDGEEYGAAPGQKDPDRPCFPV